MDMMDIARRDARTFVTSKSGGFAVDAVLIDANGVEASIQLIHTKHHLTYDEDRATMVNMKNAHICFSEADLNSIAPTYQLRNADKEVFMKGHKVRVKDSTGVEFTYVMNEWYPDETLGLIVCIIGDFESE